MCPALGFMVNARCEMVKFFLPAEYHRKKKTSASAKSRNYIIPCRIQRKQHIIAVEFCVCVCVFKKMHTIENQSRLEK